MDLEESRGCVVDVVTKLGEWVNNAIVMRQQCTAMTKRCEMLLCDVKMIMML